LVVITVWGEIRIRESFVNAKVLVRKGARKGGQARRKVRRSQKKRVGGKGKKNSPAAKKGGGEERSKNKGGLKAKKVSVNR